MRVAYVCADPGLPAFGCKGASVHLQEVVRALCRRGHDVVLLATRLGGPPPPGLEGIEVHPLPAVGPGTGIEREQRSRAANAGLERALDGAGPVDLVYERYSLWSWAAMAWSRRQGVPGVLEVNAPLIDEQAAHRTLVDRQAAERCARAAFAGAGAVVCVSEPVARWVRTRSGPGARVTVVANGVDAGRITPGPERMPGATFTVGFVGTLKAWHGVQTLVDATARLARDDPTYRLLVVGDGPERRRLVEAVEDRGLGSVATFTGAVEPAAVPGYLRAMDVAVAPYPPLDGFYFSPLKLFEYLAAGRAIVASDIGQVAEVIDDGRTGVLCRPGDPLALARALAELRADPARRRALGRAARADAVAHRSWDRAVDRILDLAECREAVA
ncbi:MAG TPA: glycosyltransferase family 4 protein [Acidimicrobiales bacterium]|nr:glycosyltransferase family 4 protein [Acidimicrobiales bacterium]